MKRNNKINIVVGGTFHTAMLVKKLENLEYDVKIYTSTPKFKFKKESFYKQVVYVPMFFQIYRKISKRLISSKMKYFDKTLFDFLVSIFMRKCDLLYGFAGVSLFCGKKTINNGGKYILDRACPHIDFQNDLLKNEAKVLNINFFDLDEKMLKRCKDEYNLADKIIVPSSYSSKTFLDKGFLKSKIKIVPLEAKSSIPESKSLNSNGNNELIFCSVGGGLLRKGFLYLLRAWDELQLSNAKLFLKTNKKELEKSKEINRILKNNNNIIFHTHYNDINDFYKQCDVFCIPSIDDGFGMVVPEAMANSLPCIVTENVGASSLIKDGKNGFILPIQDSEKIKIALMYFYNNRDKVYKMGQTAFSDYLEYIKNNNYEESLDQAIRE